MQSENQKNETSIELKNTQISQDNKSDISDPLQQDKKKKISPSKIVIITLLIVALVLVPFSYFSVKYSREPHIPWSGLNKTSKRELTIVEQTHLNNMMTLIVKGFNTRDREKEEIINSSLFDQCDKAWNTLGNDLKDGKDDYLYLAYQLGYAVLMNENLNKLYGSLGKNYTPYSKNEQETRELIDSTIDYYYKKILIF